LAEERLTRSRSLGRDQEAYLVVLAAFLQGAVAGVIHGEKMKTSVEVRKRKKRWLFQAWGWPACG
jgi:hypothetical protein